MCYLDHCFPLVVIFWSKTLLIQQILMMLPILALYHRLRMSKWIRLITDFKEMMVPISRSQEKESCKHTIIMQYGNSWFSGCLYRVLGNLRRWSWLILWEGAWEDFSKKGRFKISFRDFAGSPVTKMHTPNVGGLGLIPGRGTRSHMPQWRSKILDAKN